VTTEDVVAVTVRVPRRTRVALRVLGGVLGASQASLIEQWADQAIGEHGLYSVLQDALRNDKEAE
jgi:hypothetical protein